MTLITALLLLLLGFVLLVFGGDLLVKGAIGLAEKLNVSPLIIGLTIVAAGTSAPEIITSFMASMKGNPDIAIGNIVGSNLFNMLGILGVTSLLTVNIISKTIIKSEFVLLVFFTLAFMGLTWDQQVTMTDSSIFIALLVGFILFTIYRAKKYKLQPVDEEELESYSNFKVTLLALIGGFVLLIVGSEFALRAGIRLGQIAGLSDRIIGLTIISVGTGLPELAASAMAALRKQGDLAFSNIIGSNIINTLGIPATAGLFATAQIDASIVQFDSPILLISTLLIFPLAYICKFRFSKVSGLILTIAYSSYIAYLCFN